MSLPERPSIETKADFLCLVAQLLAEPDDWPNGSAPEYIAALGAWLEDADGFYRNIGQVVDTSQPSWQLFADMLQAARVYE